VTVLADGEGVSPYSKTLLLPYIIGIQTGFGLRKRCKFIQLGGIKYRVYAQISKQAITQIYEPPRRR
jgi:hypothetical protein